MSDSTEMSGPSKTTTTTANTSLNLPEGRPSNEEIDLYITTIRAKFDFSPKGYVALLLRTSLIRLPDSPLYHRIRKLNGRLSDDPTKWDSSLLMSLAFLANTFYEAPEAVDALNETIRSPHRGTTDYLTALDIMKVTRAKVIKVAREQGYQEGYQDAKDAAHEEAAQDYFDHQLQKIMLHHKMAHPDNAECQDAAVLRQWVLSHWDTAHEEHLEYWNEFESNARARRSATSAGGGVQASNTSATVNGGASTSAENDTPSAGDATPPTQGETTQMSTSTGSTTSSPLISDDIPSAPARTAPPFDRPTDAHAPATPTPPARSILGKRSRAFLRDADDDKGKKAQKANGGGNKKQKYRDPRQWVANQEKRKD